MEETKTDSISNPSAWPEHCILGREGHKSLNKQRPWGPVLECRLGPSWLISILAEVCCEYSDGVGSWLPHLLLEGKACLEVHGRQRAEGGEHGNNLQRHCSYMGSRRS